MSAAQSVRATAYLVVKADVRNGTVRSAKVTASRRSRPDLAWDEIAVKVHLDLPSTIFERITPEAVIEVPGDIVVHPVITATAQGDSE